MSTYTPEFLLSLLPPIMSDLDVNGDLYDFLEIFTEQLNDFETEIGAITDFYNPNLAPSVTLEYLAQAFGVSFNKNFSDDQLRTAITSAVYWYRRKGTVGALESLIDSLGYSSTFLEYKIDSSEREYTITPLLNITGVTLDYPTGVFTSYPLFYDVSANTLTWGNGIPMLITGDGYYTLIASDGVSTIRAAVVAGSLPGTDANDSVVIIAKPAVLFTDSSDYLPVGLMDSLTGWVSISSPGLSLTTETVGTNIGFINSNPDVITRSSGNFITDGWTPGQNITVLGSTSNDGNYTISLVGVTAITLIPGDSLVTEGIGAAISLYPTEEVKVGIAAIKFDKDNSLSYTGMYQNFPGFIIKDANLSRMRCEWWVYLPPVYSATPLFDSNITGVTLKLSNDSYSDPGTNYWSWTTEISSTGIPLQVGWNKIAINLFDPPTSSAGAFDPLAAINSITLIVNTLTSADLITGLLMDGLRFYSGGTQSPYFDVQFSNPAGLPINPTISGYLKDEVMTNKPVYAILYAFTYLIILTSYLDLVATLTKSLDVDLPYLPTLYTDQDLPPQIVLPVIIYTDTGLLTDYVPYFCEIVIVKTP